MKLVIVESPAKAKTIEKILGKGYKVEASVGHVRDLPPKNLGIDIKNNFEPKYVETTRGKDVLKKLRAAAKKADEIYLAPDPDREGEAIAWHLKEALTKGVKAPFKRVAFNEITKAAVSKAFENPGVVDMDRVESQQARRLLDRIVGFQVSPLLWSNIKRGVSAGRVQSVALRLVCEKERDILAFEPVEYWNFMAELDATSPNSGKRFSAKLAKISGKKLDINNEKDAMCAKDAVQNSKSWTIDSIETTPRKKNPYPPFITSTLQQSASSMLRFNSRFTMQVAQQLYEGFDIAEFGHVGLITYMRTDSFAIAKEAQGDALGFISTNYGNEYVPKKPNFYKSKAGSQGAHEAIRPTNVELTPTKLKKYLDEPQLKLYTLIWNRFVASQMAQAKLMRTTVEVNAKGADTRDYLFKTSVTITVFQGFMKVFKGDSEEDGEGLSAELAKLKQGDTCFLNKLDTEQKFTEPPSRFSEASLIRELEANGVGRPSTYASIVNTIQDREYVNRDKGRLFPTELGFSVCDFLVAKLPHLFEVSFTAKMESELDNIEQGDLEWHQMLQNFYSNFEKWVISVKHEGAPDADKTKALIALISDNVKEWQKPDKVGPREYSDEKFFTSVKKKFEKDSIVSAKQWSALIRIGLNYQEQIKGLADLAKKFKFEDDLKTVESENIAFKKKAAASKISDEEAANYAELFTACVDIKWDEPTKKGKRVFDDSKFYNSLKSQVETGRVLSEKQVQALARIVNKYIKQTTVSKELLEKLSLAPSKEEVEQTKNPVVEQQIEFLSKVTKWKEPVKKGKRVYDDKDFFDSIAGQYKSGRSLSARQVAAFAKLHAKYASGEEIDGKSEGAPISTIPKKEKEELDKAFAQLAKVTDWAEPVKKGRRTFSDKSFYESLKKQYDGGRELSVKQVAALKKLVSKY